MEKQLVLKFKWKSGIMIIFYVPIYITTMILRLRRTLIRSTILIITFDVHFYSRRFLKTSFLEPNKEHKKPHNYLNPFSLWSHMEISFRIKDFSFQ